MTERLQKCLDAGSVAELFPMLSTWEQPELKALLADIEKFYDDSQGSIEKAYKDSLFEPSNFFSKRRGEELDNAYRDNWQSLFSTCAEVASVAMFYLRDGGTVG
jgi:hypothetical protein